MKDKMKKIFSMIGYVTFFCGYAYVLFFHLFMGMSSGGIESRWQGIKILVAAFLLATGFPGIVCYQHHKIRVLKKKLQLSCKKEITA